MNPTNDFHPGEILTDRLPRSTAPMLLYLLFALTCVALESITDRGWFWGSEPRTGVRP